MSCDDTLQRYASAVNSFPSTTSDLIPSLLLFSGIECGSSIYPSSGGTFVSNPFTQLQIITISNWTFSVVASFFIPFNFSQVKFTSTNGRTSTFLGPWFVTDTSKTDWQVNGTNTTTANMFDDSIASIQFLSILDWNSQALEPMCMGQQEYIGYNPLTRFQGQTPRCDTFMGSTWCAQSSPNISNTECSCFQELPEIEAKSEQLNVDLPVICFGQGCATQTSYKTLSMLSKPCNLTICQQTVESTPGIVNQGQDTVFCGGQFYKQNGTIVQPSVSPLVTPTNTSSSETPFYVWIMLGVSGLLFAILVYLLFSDKQTKQSSVLRQIKKLSLSQKSNGNN